MFPAQSFTNLRHFGSTQRRAMHAARALFVWAAKANGGFAANQSGLVVVIFGLNNRRIQSRTVMSINVRDHLPTICCKTRRGIIRKPTADFAIDGDIIIIIKNNEFTQAPRAC